MRVNLYIIDQRTGIATLECSAVDLKSCFPEADDATDLSSVSADLERTGFAIFGGGAAALIRFEKV